MYELNIEQQKLHREDLRDLVELTVGRMDIYNLVPSGTQAQGHVELFKARLQISLNSGPYLGLPIRACRALASFKGAHGPSRPMGPYRHLQRPLESPRAVWAQEFSRVISTKHEFLTVCCNDGP